MNPDPDLLIAAAVAGALDEADAAALADLARRNPAVLRSLRLHLVIDEVAAQELLPSRSVAAFAAGLAERRRVHDDGFAFLAQVRARIAAEDRVHALLTAPVAPEPAVVVRPRPAQPVLWWPAAAAALLAAVLLAGATTAQAGASDGAGSNSVLVQSAKEGLIRPFVAKDRP